MNCEMPPCRRESLPLKAGYIFTWKHNGEDVLACDNCATLGIMAGMGRSRKLTMGDVMTGKFSKAESEDER